MAWFAAVAAGDLAYLIQHKRAETGAFDEDGFSGLMRAALADDLPVARVLVDVEAGLTTTRGETALLLAAAHDSVGVVPVLLPFEREITLSGLTPLHVAVQHESVRVIPLLMAPYATRRSAVGLSPLDHGASLGKAAALEVLLAYGPYTAEDMATAAALARAGGHEACEKLLLAAALHPRPVTDPVQTPATGVLVSSAAPLTVEALLEDIPLKNPSMTTSTTTTATAATVSPSLLILRNRSVADSLNSTLAPTPTPEPDSAPSLRHLLALKDAEIATLQERVQEATARLQSSGQSALEEELAYYRQLLASRSSQEEALGRELEKLKLEGQQVLSTLRERAEEQDCPQSPLRGELRSALTALAFVVKQLWATLDSSLDVSESVSGAETLPQIIAELKRFKVQLQLRLNGRGAEDCTYEALRRQVGELAEVLEENERITGDLRAELERKTQTHTQALARAEEELSTIREEHERHLEALRTELQEARLLITLEKDRSQQAEERLDHYLELHRTELSLLNDELAEASARVTDVYADLRGTMGRERAQGATTLTGKLELLLEALRDDRRERENAQYRLESVEGELENLRVANAELSRLADVYGGELKDRNGASLSNSALDTQARILSLETENDSLRGEVIELTRALYQARAASGDAQVQAEVIELREQLEKYTRAYDALKSSSVALGEELDAARTQIRLLHASGRPGVLEASMTPADLTASGQE
ncbi:Ankyrin repeat protein 1 [Giardia muris]|uniref:Ankyrin repeat protein 1 n=1 Tax=Giardia muris TaxID=5742 RepID=A0A4Z1SRV3_GIAMU|nr:Ankyrin repeat protein 1 [Giardia muris]|eukprot:TNJ27715.1 Ankyrin repeat protein 1 [Giardia muris]